MPVADPVIILALPRSYSSLTCAMLGQHPQMYDLLETQLFEVDVMQQWWAEYGEDNHDADGLTRVIGEVFFGGQSPQTILAAREWLWERRIRTTGDVLKELGEQLHPLRMIEKTPLEGIDDQEVRCKLRRQLLTFPQARFLHLVRHPRAYARSHLSHLAAMSRASRHPERMARRYARILDGIVLDPQVLWYRVNFNIDCFLRGLAPEQHLRICGEDLLSEPKLQLRKIAKWLGLSTNAATLAEMQHPDRSPFACFGPPNARFGGDPRFFRDPVLHCMPPGEESLADALEWRTDGSGFHLETRLLAREFGYN
jgi:hypothetical protein